jgi:hypothetical protein
MVLWIWQAMSGNGLMTGIVIHIIEVRQRRIHWVRIRVSLECCVAARVQHWPHPFRLPCLGQSIVRRLLLWFSLFPQCNPIK